MTALVVVAAWLTVATVAAPLLGRRLRTVRRRMEGKQ